MGAARTMGRDDTLTMKELVQASGGHRQTIHAYLRKGLLVPPLSGAHSRNARYSPKNVELLALIRELRDERGMSLEAIHRCFERASFDPGEVRRSLGAAAAPANPLLNVGSDEPLAGSTLVAEAAAAPELLRVFVEAGAITPVQNDPAGRFDRESVAVLAAAQRLRALGLGTETIVRIARLTGEIAALEATSFAGDVSEDSAGAPLRAEERYERVTALMNATRLGAIRRVHRLLENVAARSRSFAADAAYVPSPMFVKRHKLDEVLAHVEATATTGHVDVHSTLRHGRLLLGLGRYEESIVWLTRAVQRDPSIAETHQYLGLAQTMAGLLDGGIATARRAVELAPRSPRAHAFLGVALALRAASTIGLEEGPEALAFAFDVAAGSRAFEAADPREHLEVLLARGRLFTVLPGQVPGQAEGVADLETVLALTASRTEEENRLDYPGASDVYRIHALFYLGVDASHKGDVELARRRLTECIAIDPGSRFAERAYEMLG